MAGPSDGDLSCAADTWPLSAREAAAVLGVSDRTVRRAIAQGDLQAVLHAGVYRIAPDDLAQFRIRREAVGFANLRTPRSKRRVMPPTKQEREFDVDLPQPLSPLVGREAETEAVCALVRKPDVRLVTLTGPGGVGKTRLALRVGQELNNDFRDGVVVVSLAAIRDPALVLPAIARVLGLRDRSNRPSLEQLTEWLRERSLLLILDNLEQVVIAAVELMALLSRCPALKMLATSRVVLNVTGERLHDVPPFDLPDLGRLPPLVDLARSEPVALFVQRAQTVQPSFALDEANGPIIAAICVRLDGLPLAIELAAARMRHLSPRQLLAKLTNALPLLIGGSRDQPERLRTMEAAIRWSYDLLSQDEKLLFQCLSVFVGGADLVAAEAVAGERSPRGEIVRRIAALVDDSLLRVGIRAGGEARYAMLETIREFGIERLAESGDSDAVRDAHARYFLKLTEMAVPQFDGPDLVVWKDRVEIELPNCHAAMTWATERGDAETVCRMTGALWRVWLVRGYPSEQRRWIESGLAMRDQAPPTARIDLLHGAGSFYVYTEENAERAQGIAEELLSTGKAIRDDYGVFWANQLLGILAERRGDFDSAEAHHRRALDLAPGVRNPDNHVAWAVHSLGAVSFRRGDFTDAATQFEESLSKHRATGNPFGIGTALSNLARARLALGDITEADTILRGTLILRHSMRDVPGVRDALTRLVQVAAARRQWTAVGRLLGAVDAVGREYGLIPDSDAAPELERQADAARRMLGEKALAAAWDAGSLLSVDSAIAEALGAAGANAPTASPALRDLAAEYGLTPREMEVLRLLPSGMTDREIATVLFVAANTVSHHVQSILAKLNLPKRGAAVAWAVRQGLA